MLIKTDKSHRIFSDIGLLMKQQRCVNIANLAFFILKEAYKSQNSLILDDKDNNI